MTTWTSFNFLNIFCIRFYAFIKQSTVELNNCIIEKNVKLILKNKSKFFVDNNSILKSNCELRVYENSSMIINKNCTIDNGVRIIAANKKTVLLEKNVKIGYYSVLNGGGGITIGANSSFYGYVYVKTSFHKLAESGFEKNEYYHRQLHIPENSLIEPFTIL